MSTVWRYTAMILAGAVLLLGTGLYTLRAAQAGHGDPRRRLAVRKVLGRMGGEAGLAARKAQLAGLVARLRQERAAHVADAAAFSRRIEEVFAELGLQLTASSDWKAVPKFKVPRAAAFERTLAGIGPFDRLLDAIATIESWPDSVRVRSLSVSRQGPGAIAFTLEITAVRSVGGRVQEPPPPRWQSFLRPGERATLPRPVVLLAQGAPNPFDRLAVGGGARAARPESSGLRLEGIAGGARAVALISGHAVREGGEISGYRVVRIGRSAVTLAGPQGSRLDLTLGEGR